MVAIVFKCVDIINSRKEFADQRKNPLKKISAAFVANARDEKITEE